MAQSPNRPFVCAFLAAAFIASVPAFADVAYDGIIRRLGGNAVGNLYDSGTTISSIDRIPFTVNTAGTITFDLRSIEFDDSSGALIDLNGDGRIACIDPMIYVFRNDGSLGVDDLLGQNDDNQTPGQGTADGSVSGLDSYLPLFLNSGNYFLMVGGFAYTAEQGIAGVNPGLNGLGFYPCTFDTDLQGYVTAEGDYRVTFGGDVSVVPSPAAATILALGGALAARRRRR